jgi:hypothetical protein
VLGESARDTRRKARQWRVFAFLQSVSRLPFWVFAARKSRNSPAGTWKTPVFGRLRPETGFDPHSVAGLAVQLAKFSPLAAGKLGLASPHCRADAASKSGGAWTHRWKKPEGGPHGLAIERENYEVRQEEINSFFGRPLEILTEQDYRRTSSSRRAVCIRRLERFRVADDDSAANVKPLVPGRALPTAEPLPRGPALLDDVGRLDGHPMPACRPTSVTFAPALDGALTVNRTPRWRERSSW